MIAGTDMGANYVIPGFSMHDELQLMVEAGLSTLTALQAATINPVKFLGKENDLGTIEKGKLADLVLLEGNPLENIQNTRRIAAVMVNGRYLPKESLQRMLNDVEATVENKSSAMPASSSIRQESHSYLGQFGTSLRGICSYATLVLSQRCALFIDRNLTFSFGR